MALTVNMDDFKAVNRQRCLRTSDIKSIVELAKEMNGNENEFELLRMARTMLRQGDRNERAQHNERNVELFKDLLVDRTRTGDVLTTYSACELLRERGIDYHGAKYYALLAALDDLTNEGYFVRDTVKKRGVQGHYVIYIVR